MCALLNQPADGSENSPTILFKRLSHFCRRNTSDYFIHKDLKGFLTRELEFYIKDQIIHLMDLEADIDAKRRVIRTFQKLADKVIEFLATIENVQKILLRRKVCTGNRLSDSYPACTARILVGDSVQ